MINYDLKQNKKAEMIDQEGIKIELHIVDDADRLMLVSVSGYVDQANCHLLQKTIDKCLDNKYYRLVFNLQKLVYMSSAGWGVLIGEIKRFRENGGDIKLANMGPEIYEIYQMLEFYHIISEYPSIEDALKSFNVKTAEDSEEPLIEEIPAEDDPVEEIAPEKEIFEPRLLIPRQEKPVKEAPAEEEPMFEEDAFETETASESEEETSAEIEDAAAAHFDDMEIAGEEEDVETYEEPKPVMKDTPKEKPVEPRRTPEPPPAAAEEEPEELEAEAENASEAAYYEEDSYLDDSGDSEEVSEDKQEVVLDDEIEINIDGLLADEGISTSVTAKKQSSYVEFDPEKHKRRIDIKIMPVPDKIRDIVARNPELTPGEIRRMLRHPDYGAVKIGFFKFKSLLKALELDTKKKRYRFHRSS